MRSRLRTFRSLGAEVLGIDPHEMWSAKSLLKDSGLEASDVNFPLLTDPAITVSATYGVAFQMRIHTEISNRPAVFIIDRDGVIRYASRAKTFSDRPSVKQIVEELKKLSAKE